MAQKSVSTLEVLVVQRARDVAVEGELEVLLPVERRARLGEVVVPVARAGDAERHVGRVRRDLVGDAALLHVVHLGQAQVLFRGHVAQHARAVVPGRRGADGAGDVVVAGEHVGHERPEHVERRAMTDGALQLHVELDLVEGHVARALDHDLHALAPGALGQLAQRRQLGQLRASVASARPPGRRPSPSENDTSYSRMISQMSRSACTWGSRRRCVSIHLAKQRAAARHDADEAVADERQVRARHARVDGEVVHALLRLVLAASRR
jgi:hypothetical protein